jgi:hypothetical protein
MSFLKFANSIGRLIIFNVFLLTFFSVSSSTAGTFGQDVAPTKYEQKDNELFLYYENVLCFKVKSGIDLHNLRHLTTNYCNWEMRMDMKRNIGMITIRWDDGDSTGVFLLTMPERTLINGQPGMIEFGSDGFHIIDHKDNQYWVTHQR